VISIHFATKQYIDLLGFITLKSVRKESAVEKVCNRQGIASSPFAALINYKKLSYRRGTARRAMLVNSCYVSRAMGVIKVSNSKSKL